MSLLLLGIVLLTGVSLIHIVRLLTLCLCMIDDILNVWTQVFRIGTAHCGGLLSSVKLLWLVNLLLNLLI